MAARNALAKLEGTSDEATPSRGVVDPRPAIPSPARAGVEVCPPGPSQSFADGRTENARLAACDPVQKKTTWKQPFGAKLEAILSMP